ncbi:MAG: hypothetical protein WBC74_06300, partial [Candidatus Omnitrophota bacterium]
IENLKLLIETYKTRPVTQFAEFLIGFLYYGDAKYNKALRQFRKIESDYPDSVYHYAAQTLIEDIKDIGKGNPPAFASVGGDTYKRWEPYTPIRARIVPEISGEGKTASLGSIIRSFSIALEDSSKAYARDASGEDEVQIVSLEGEVKVLPKDEKNWTDAKWGMILRAGDRIKTGPASSCVLSFDKKTKNVVGIFDNSDVVMLLDAEKKLEVIDAYLLARLSAIPEGSTFEVKTPTAVCGARGTGLGIKAGKKSTEGAAYENDIFIRNVKSDTVEEKSIREGFLRRVDKSGEISEEIEADPEDIAKFQSWSVFITVKPGARITFALDSVKDFDRYGIYLYDTEDLSRLPKKIDNEVEEDLLTVTWSREGGGRFLDGKQGLKKVWQAPDEPGTYKVSVRIDDIALTRPPDEGIRKDPEPRDLTVVVIVKE